MSRLQALALGALLALGSASALPAQSATHLGVPQSRLFHLRFYKTPSDAVDGALYSGLAIFDGAGKQVSIPAGMTMVITDLRVTHMGIPFTNGTWEILEVDSNTNQIGQQKWQVYLPQTNVAGVHHDNLTSGLVFAPPMRPILATNMDQNSVVNTLYAYGYFIATK